MFKALWQTLQKECSGMSAYQAIADISRYHRIQASPGFRRAAEYIHNRLVESGIQSEMMHFPANTTTSFWGAHSFREWDARAGTLHLIEPQNLARKLADYGEVPISLIQRSVAFEGEVEVVAVEKGEKPAEYEGLDVAGKVVLARGDLRRVYDLAVRRRGAVGIVFDGMAEVEPVRPAWALPDAIQYTSFWWFGEEPKCFGFALSPREGEKLRRLIQKRRESGEGSVRVQAHVDAHLYDGTLDVVSATISGQDDEKAKEEIVLVSHLCHPQPSCNDNASGAAAVLEVARTLQNLIATGQLPRPRRSLRFLWPPEMIGSYAFLSTNESRIPRMVAGLNLDMVGQDQAQCGSSFLIERPPDALPSFAPDLLTRLREMLFPEAKTYTRLGGYPLFRHAITPFAGGSDHYVFSDPSVGVPMPMIIQWPDRFYHSTEDTLDKVDPAMLGKTAVLAAAYAYWLAQADRPETYWLASEMSARFRQQVIGIAQTAATDAREKGEATREALRGQLEHEMERHQKALGSLTRLAPVDVNKWQTNDEAFAQAEFNRVSDLLPQRPDSVDVDGEAARLIPRRQFRGPLSATDHVSRLDKDGRDEWWELNQRIGKEASRTVPALAQYWADGQRTVAEIGQRIVLETGIEATPLLIEYFRFVQRLGLVQLDER